MPRIKIWSGDEETAARIIDAIHRSDPKGKIAKDIESKVVGDETILIATFPSKDDGCDAAAFADGYAMGFHDGVNSQDDEEEIDPDEEEETDPDDEEDEDENEDEDEEDDAAE